MSAPSGHPSLRARIAAALSMVLSDRSNADVGRTIGADRSTIARRGADLHEWPSDDLLKIAGTDILLAYAIRDCVIGQGDEVEQPCEPTSIMADLLEEIRDSAELTRRSAEAMSAGKVSPSEAAELLAMLIAHRKSEEKHIRDLRAVAAKGGGR
jgi:hypothetical protein